MGTSQDVVPLLQYTDTDDDWSGGKKTPNQNSPSSSPVAVESSSSWSKGKGQNYYSLENWIRGARVQWFLLSKRSRMLVIILILFLAFHTLVGVFDLFLWKFNDTAQAVYHASSFDVVINTFRRPEMLVGAVRHYADTCGVRSGVNHIYIVWAEEGVVPPKPDSFFAKSSVRQTQDRSPVTIIKVKNSLNSRFEPIAGVQDAVFMVDDDVRVNCRDLQAAFAAWKAHPNSLVGYYPRLSTENRFHGASGLVYHSWPIVYWRGQMNIILTKACFMHQRYLALYTDDSHPKQIKEFVDKYFNCEDIAMAMLVGNVTRNEFSVPARPIFVQGRVSDLGLFNGISSGTGHMARRSDCLNELNAIYKEHGWKAPLDSNFALSESSWLQHFPGFWWQQRPSNPFEWAALANVLK